MLFIISSSKMILKDSKETSRSANYVAFRSKKCAISSWLGRKKLTALVSLQNWAQFCMTGGKSIPGWHCSTLTQLITLCCCADGLILIYLLTGW